MELGEAALKLGHFDVSYPLRYHLALAYVEQKRFGEALGHCDAIISGDSSLNIRAHSYALLAELYASMDNKPSCYKALAQGLRLIENSDHKDAQTVIATACLKFGTDAQVMRIRPLLESLSQQPLAAYLEKEFQSAVALGRHNKIS